MLLSQVHKPKTKQKMSKEDDLANGKKGPASKQWLKSEKAIPVVRKKRELKEDLK